MMGYADLSQTDTGLHMRQFSRAYIVAAPGTLTAKDRILFINSDIAMGDTAIRRGVLQKLAQKYPGVYDESNVALVGTHSHSGVGGFLNNLLPTLTSLGFVEQTYDAIVDGTVLAVDRAHKSLAPGTLSLGNTTVLDTNLNRSPYSYTANPAEERAMYQYDQDKDLHLLKFTDNSGTARGFLSFFAVHGTSIYQASWMDNFHTKIHVLTQRWCNPMQLLERIHLWQVLFNEIHRRRHSYTSIALLIPITAPILDPILSHIRRGPGFRVSDFESNRIIGENQFQGAKTLMDGNSLRPVQGAVKSLHTYVDMSNYSFALTNGTTVHTCPPAMGYSFAGGTTDGPGIITAPPSEEQKRCHYPKPILLNTGYTKFPYAWQPDVVDIQMMRVGQLVILVVPGEFTTMAGRRIRESVRAKLISSGVIGNDAYVVIAGPANTYSHYVTTREEYGIQRYEGASTIYGPFTLEAYQNLYTGLVSYLADGATSSPPTGPVPEDLTKNAISLQPGVVLDAVPIGKSFGFVLTDVNTATPYARGQRVSAVFQAANPRNNLRLEDTFLTVDRLTSGTWTTYRTDSHPSTKLRWTRTNVILGYSTVEIEWIIESDVPAGTYRITYRGDSKPFIGPITSFTGKSRNFTVSA
ncbi:hypothetical protein FRC10_010164 [Ceratobasidium sp. 414]|nr:hypothetical protein FRC10_010164 [Ceratobasidium sp. 414]